MMARIAGRSGEALSIDEESPGVLSVCASLEKKGRTGKVRRTSTAVTVSEASLARALSALGWTVHNWRQVPVTSKEAK